MSDRPYQAWFERMLEAVADVGEPAGRDQHAGVVPDERQPRDQRNHRHHDQHLDQSNAALLTYYSN